MHAHSWRVSPLCVTRMQTCFSKKKLSVVKIKFWVHVFFFSFLSREKWSTRSDDRVDFVQIICVFISIFSVCLLKINLFSVNCQFLFFECRHVIRAWRCSLCQRGYGGDGHSHGMAVRSRIISLVDGQRPSMMYALAADAVITANDMYFFRALRRTRELL